jgi:hypothetical protein
MNGLARDRSGARIALLASCAYGLLQIPISRRGLDRARKGRCRECTLRIVIESGTTDSPCTSSLFSAARFAHLPPVDPRRKSLLCMAGRPHRSDLLQSEGSTVHLPSSLAGAMPILPIQLTRIPRARMRASPPPRLWRQRQGGCVQVRISLGRKAPWRWCVALYPRCRRC